MTIELVPLCDVTVSLATPIVVSPTFAIGEVVGLEIEGERLRGRLKGNAAADWLTISPAGIGTLDVKVTFETHDGAIVHATYSGRFPLATFTVYAAPLFHTGDERYAWLNGIQAVAKGTFPNAPDTSTLLYEMYEVR